ncbi:RNA cytidine acetyltransferase-like isoform X2 [Littorina saxatilis]|uniref:RNA cytidine acetyltransferase n=1 Tax=Littorina saxatilis TaxID=31220 RepID=A0AAN9G8V5_9CAEN
MEEEKGRKTSNLLKVDNRIRILIENGVAKQHRSMFVVVGDHGKDQVVFLHHMLSKAMIKARPSVLWCYKKELGFSSHRKKRMKKLDKKIKSGRVDVNTDDQFELFIAGTNIRYCYYAETHKILGNTYGMAVLQDFEAMTPNLLARSIETIEGGGLVVVLLPNKQLSSLKMDVHDRYRTESHQDVVARFNQRFMRSLSTCQTCMVLDDKLNVLSQNTIEPVVPRSLEDKVEMPELEGTTKLTEPLVKKCKTTDQGKAVLKFVDAIADKSLRSTVAMTAGRGRGKSAALGLAIAAAVAYDYSNIFVTAPSPENLKTLFEFIFKGFDALGYQEHMDYTIITSTNPDFNKAVVRVNVTRGHRQTIQYIHPSDSVKLGQAELLCVDEAAAIPLPLVKNLLGPYLVFLSSTVSGYEGTGRSLSLKLIQQLRQQSATYGSVSGEGKKLTDMSSVMTSGRKLQEITLEESIRYGNKDPVERWLNNLLCLDATVPRISAGCPAPQACQLFYVNRDQLFSYNKPSETFLQRVISLFVSSHYKNSPNDLQMLSDAPAHHIFVLLGPIGAKSTGLPDVLCVIQVCLEGEISKASIMNSLSRGKRASGDLIPWTISQQFLDSDFASLSGARIVRIATHPDYQAMGYGTRAMELLQQYYEGKMPSLDASDGESDTEATENNAAGGEDAEKKLPPLLCKLSSRRAEKLDYLGVSYGLTSPLLKFWKRNAFAPVYLRQTPNDLTGEHTCIMLRCLNEDSEEEDTQSPWLRTFWMDFRERFLALLAYEFRTFRPQLALSLLDQKKFKLSTQDMTEGSLLSAYKVKRLEQYAHNLVDYHQIVDLMPTLAQLYFSGKICVHLSVVQDAVLLALGLQHKGVDTLTKELDLPTPQVLALFNKSVRKLCNYLKEQQEKEVEASLPAAELEIDMRPAKQTLEEDLKEAAASMHLNQYAIKGNEKSWKEALSADTSSKGIISVKGTLKRKRLEQGEEVDYKKKHDKKKNKKKSSEH